MFSTLSRMGARLGLAVGAVLLWSSTAVALQPPAPGELGELAKRNELEPRLARARQLQNDRTNPRLIWQLRQKVLRAAGASDQQIAAEIGNAPPPDWQGGLPATGTPKIFVLLVDFPEYPRGAANTPADVDSKFFGNGDASQAPYESLRNYYQRASYNQLTIQGTVFDWYRAQNSRTYYESLGFGKGQEILMKEAIQYWDGQGHDFTQYDNNSDGRIDGFFIKWTGPDNGWSNFWWAYQWSWHVETSFTVDGKQLGAYVWSWIANPVGTIYAPQVDIHETGHLLGLPDLYDYNGTLGPDGGVGNLDMMDGNWGDHNCFSKYMLGWLTPTVVGSGSLTKNLNPSGTSKDCVLIMPGANSGTLFGEFFMAQYRKRSTGNDPSSYPTDGMVIWHIDSTLTSDGTDFEYDNSYTEHKYIRLMEADGLEEIEQNGSADTGDFYRPPSTFDSGTSPSSRNYAGQTTGVGIDQLGTPGQTMSGRFRVTTGPDLIIAGWSLTSEGCPPGNGAVDPNETVTLNIQLNNVGLGATSSLTATLLPTGGVTSPSAAQNYGTIQPGGQAVGRDFTFTAEGTCGGTITLTLQLQNGTTDLGTIATQVPLGALVITFAEAFDTVTAPALPAGWSATSTGNVQKWRTSTTYRDTAPNAAFASDPGTVTDNILQSPSIPILSASAQLVFRHRYDLESHFDGGVLEISIAGGAFQDILAAGGSFESGGYNDSISLYYDNPLAGRQAWSGSHATFSTVVVNLPPNAVGQSVQFRWRVGTDVMVSASGWYVDSIAMHDGFGCCDPLAIPGDFDGDRDVDQEDFGAFQTCFSGSVIPQLDGACLKARLDGDSDVDGDDLALFTRCMTGPGRTGDPDCRG